MLLILLGQLLLIMVVVSLRLQSYSAEESRANLSHMHMLAS